MSCFTKYFCLQFIISLLYHSYAGEIIFIQDCRQPRPQGLRALGTVHLLRILQWWGKTTKGPIRAVASIYSWGGGDGGGVGQKFPNDEKNFLIFHAGIRSHEGVCYPENGDAIYKHKYAYFTRRHITVACSAIGTSI